MFPSAGDYSEEKQQDGGILVLQSNTCPSLTNAETHRRDLINEANILEHYKLKPQKYTSIKKDIFCI